MEGERGDAETDKKREGAPPRLGAGRLPSGGGTDAGRAPRRADDGGTVSRRRRSPAAAFDEFKRLLNISLSAFTVCGCFVSVLCHSAIPAGAAWPMMTGGPRPGCAAAAPGPGAAGRRAGTRGRGSGKSGGLFGNGGRVFPHPPSDPPGVSENMAAGPLESWMEIIWDLCRTFKISSFFVI